MSILEGDSSLDLDELLTEQDAARFLKFKPRALQAWRQRGGGPHFVRISSRAVRYRRRDIVTWIESRIRSSTADNEARVR